MIPPPRSIWMDWTRAGVEFVPGETGKFLNRYCAGAGLRPTVFPDRVHIT